MNSLSIGPPCFGFTLVLFSLPTANDPSPPPTALDSTIYALFFFPSPFLCFAISYRWALVPSLFTPFFLKLL